MPRKSRDGYRSRPSGKPDGTAGAKGRKVRRRRARAMDEAELQHLQEIQFPDSEHTEEVEGEDFRSLGEIAESSGDPQAAEALWGDELLGAVRDTAETLASEAEQAASQEPPEDPVEPIPDSPLLKALEFSLDFDRTDREPKKDEPEEHSDHGQFLTTEELQTLGEVLGHFSEFSEHQYDDQESLGVPSSGWNSMENDLRGLRSSIEELQASTADVSSLKPLLKEIKSEVEVGHHRRDILTSSLSALSGDMHEVRLQVSAATRSAVDSAACVREMLGQRGQTPDAGGTADEQGPDWPVFLVGFAILPLGWAVAFYVKTGDLRTALGCLVIANLACCATILFGRPSRWLQA